MGEEKQSKAFEIMLKRKRLLMDARNIDRFEEEERFLAVQEKAQELLAEANKLGGLTSEESFALSLIR